MAEWVRRIRTRLTAGLTRVAVGTAPRLGAGVVDALEAAVAWAGPHVPVLSRMVAENMRAAGVYSPEAHRAYFAYAAAHLAGVLHVFRYAVQEKGPGSFCRNSPKGEGHLAGSPSKHQTNLSRFLPPGGRMHPELDRLVRERVLLDGSFECLREAAAGGKGVVLLGVHASNYMLVLARINQELPITVYLRHSRDPHKQAAKRAWCRTTGLDFIAEPPGLLNPARRAEFMAAALQEGRTLIITPDLAQKREQGVPVRLLDREVYLPGGPAAISLLVGAPLVTVVAAPAECALGENGGSGSMAPSADCEGGMGKRSRTPRSLPVAEEANSTLHHGQAPGRSTGPALAHATQRLAHATRRLATASLGGRHRPGGGHRAGGGRAITLRFFGPRSAEVPDRRRGWRQEAVRERLQWFADLFTTEFVRPHPELWFLWGDKRWTRVFRGDSRYTRALTELRTDN